ncbi:MAG: hypothetical protein QG671_550 [Actinomycetota bacterium]|jgi:hypothetical protein|nr:hypothetical protein [Actinomycetota bacterium]
MTKRSGRAADSPATSRFTTTTDAHHDTGTVDSIRLYRRQDGFAAPTAEERTVAQAAAVLKAAGYGIAMRCLDCGHPITSAASLARLRGPKCAAKAVADD